MTAFMRIISVLLLAGLCSCGMQPRQIEAGSTIASADQIPIVLRTILEYEESGGMVPFFCRFLDNSRDPRHARTSLLKSTEIVASSDRRYIETWLVDVNGQVKPFTVTFFSGPGGNPFGADGCWVRHVGLNDSEGVSATDHEIASQLAQPQVQEAFKTYTEKNYSFSKQFGTIMPKAFAYSNEGAWGIGVSGLQDWARRFALEKCEAMRQPSDSKCSIVSIDGKWTR